MDKKAAAFKQAEEIAKKYGLTIYVLGQVKGTKQKPETIVADSKMRVYARAPQGDTESLAMQLIEYQWAREGGTVPLHQGYLNIKMTKK